MDVRIPLMLALAAIFAATTSAAGDDDSSRRKAKPLKVEIDDVSSDLRPAGPDWLLRVSYEVDVSHARGGEQLTLLMRVLENGAPLLDGEGREIVLAADLACPSNDDDFEFDRSISVRVPRELIAWPYELRIDAEIQLAGDDPQQADSQHAEPVVLDREDCRVRVKLPTVYVHRPWGVGVHFHYSR